MTYLREEKPATKNPLVRLWDLIRSFGAIIGLSSMVQNWFDDLFAWKGFIASIIESYRSIIEPIMDFLFGWLPWTIPMWVGDYLSIGLIWSFGFILALVRLSGVSRREAVHDVLLFPVMFTPFWPLVVLMTVALVFTPDPNGPRWAYNPDSDRTREEQIQVCLNNRRYGREALWSIAAVFIGTVVLLAINTQLGAG